MKTLLRFIPLLLVPILFTACVVSIGGKTNVPPPYVPAPEMPPPPTGLPAAEAATVAEIDAAARLSSDASKLEALDRIAGRSTLAPSVQIHLVNVALRRLSSETHKLQLLRTLIANPDFSDPARQAIVTQLDLLSFDANKQAILKELNSRVTGK